MLYYWLVTFVKIAIYLFHAFDLSLTPEKNQKTINFLFSGGAERDQWHEIS